MDPEILGPVFWGPNAEFEGLAMAAHAKRWIATVLFLGLAICAGTLGRAELAGVQVVQAALANPNRLGHDGLKAGMSLRTMDRAVLACVHHFDDKNFLFMTGDSRKALMRSCSAVAKNVLASAPSHGAAHLLNAQIAEAGNDKASQMRDIEISQMFSPAEGWLAERRLTMALRAGALDAGATRADMAVLLTSQSGAELLAQHYARNTATQAAITAALADATNEDRQRFVNLVKQRAARR